MTDSTTPDQGTPDQGPLDRSVESVRGLVSRAHHDIAAGAIIDLAPLEARVQDLCQAIATLPRDEGVRYRDTLISLMDDLGTLSTQVQTGLDALSSELGTASKRRTAVSAYGKGPGAADTTD